MGDVLPLAAENDDVAVRKANEASGQDEIPDRKIPGLRPMEPKDVAQVAKLLVAHLEKFKVHQEFNKEEIEHLLNLGLSSRPRQMRKG